MSADETGKEDKKDPAAARGPVGAGPKVKPAVTIDLAAEPVKAGPSETKTGPSETKTPPKPDDDAPDARDVVEGRAPPPPPPPPPPPRAADAGSRGGGIIPLVIAAVIGGIIATVLGIVYHASGVVPTRSETIAQEALDKIDALGVSVDALDKRVAAIESQPAGPGAAALTEKLSALEALERENRDRIAKLEAAPGAPAAPPVDGGGEGAAFTAEINDIKSRIAKLEADASAAAGAVAAVSSLTDRVGALEASTKDLGDKIAAVAERPAESERAARAAAIAILQQAVETGGPFASDLAMLKALGLDEAAVAELEPLAAKDTPSVAKLQSQFPDVADAILAATMTEDPDEGFVDSIGSFFGSLVTVRPTGAIPGDSAEAIVSRMQAAVDSGDLATALSERDNLPDEGKQASAEWAQAAEDRLTINRLVDKLALSVTAPGN